jgi:hypothetical protein
MEEYARIVRSVYQKAYPINVLDLSPENQLKYNAWMNTCRMMQSIIDRDNGRGSPQALRSLCDLKAMLVL